MRSSFTEVKKREFFLDGEKILGGGKKYLEKT
jgi:hypothetical protein